MQSYHLKNEANFGKSIAMMAILPAPAFPTGNSQFLI